MENTATISPNEYIVLSSPNPNGLRHLSLLYINGMYCVDINAMKTIRHIDEKTTRLSTI
jgi:hypothetical protein